jgi:hypothetical protein
VKALRWLIMPALLLTVGLVFNIQKEYQYRRWWHGDRDMRDAVQKVQDDRVLLHAERNYFAGSHPITDEKDNRILIDIYWWETVELSRPVDWYGENATYLHILHLEQGHEKTDICIAIPSKDKNLTEDAMEEAWQKATQFDRRRT